MLRDFSVRFAANDKCNIRGTEDFEVVANSADKVTGLRKMALRNLWSGALSNERVGT